VSLNTREGTYPNVGTGAGVPVPDPGLRL